MYLCKVYLFATLSALGVIPFWIRSPCLSLISCFQSFSHCSFISNHSSYFLDKELDQAIPILAGLFEHCLLSRVQLFATLWTVTHQALLSLGWSQQEHWTGLAFSSPGGLPDPGIKPLCPISYIGRQILYTEPPGAQDSLAQDKCPLATLSKMFPFASWAWTLILCEHHIFLHLGLFHKLGLLNGTHPSSCLPGKLLSIFQAQLKVLSPRSFFSPVDITGAASPTRCPRWSPLLCHPVGTKGSELLGISSFFLSPQFSTVSFNRVRTQILDWILD